MKILATGLGGFLGTNLKIPLLQTDIEFTGFSGRKNCNLLDFDKTLSLFKKAQCGTALLLASRVGGIGLNAEHPFELMSDNLTITKNSIDACIQSGVKRIILTGTICSYPRIPPRIPFYEEDIYFGQSDYSNRGYGAAKLCMMEYLSAAKREYGIDYTVLLLSNMYGNYDDFTTDGNHIIPAIIKRIKLAHDNNLDEVVCWGSGEVSRDFLHVRDCCEAIIRTIKSKDIPEMINIGTGVESTINETVHLISEIIGYKGRIVWDTSKPDGQPRRVLNIDRAKQSLGWQPETTLREGLTKTIEWYLGTLNGPA